MKSECNRLTLGNNNNQSPSTNSPHQLQHFLQNDGAGTSSVTLMDDLHNNNNLFRATMAAASSVSAPSSQLAQASVISVVGQVD